MSSKVIDLGAKLENAYATSY